MQTLVGIIMGSKSDWETMAHAAQTQVVLEYSDPREETPHPPAPSPARGEGEKNEERT